MSYGIGDKVFVADILSPRKSLKERPLFLGEVQRRWRDFKHLWVGFMLFVPHCASILNFVKNFDEKDLRERQHCPIVSGVMSTKPSMGIRLDPEDRKTLEALAARWHLNAADIVRMAIKSLLEDAKQNGGKIELPYDFKPRARKATPGLPPTGKTDV